MCYDNFELTNISNITLIGVNFMKFPLDSPCFNTWYINITPQNNNSKLEHLPTINLIFLRHCSRSQADIHAK